VYCLLQRKIEEKEEEMREKERWVAHQIIN
jgi:hypothetical protein